MLLLTFNCEFLKERPSFHSRQNRQQHPGVSERRDQWRCCNNRRKPVMSVEQPDVIDFVARDPKTDDTLVVMVEVRDWESSPIAVQQLETKLAAYSEFILS